MRIFNTLDLKTDIRRPFMDRTDEHLDRALAWLSETAVKWLLKNDPDFRVKFTSQVREHSVSKLFDAGGPQLFMYHDASTQTRQAHLENEFDVKDALAGRLFVYVPKQSLWHWITTSKYRLPEALDFILDLVASKPEEDTRKYTPDQMPRHIERWEQERMAKLERERQAMIARMEQQAETEAQYAGFMTAADRMNFETAAAYSAETEQDRMDILRNAWSLLVEGVDYRIEGEIEGQSLLRLMSFSALVWEAACKGNCIGGASYRMRLSNPNIALMSLRHKEDLVVSTYTIHAEKEVSRWRIHQIEGWGYKFASRVDALDQTRADRLKVQVEAFLNSPKFKPVLSSNEFVITRSN